MIAKGMLNKFPAVRWEDATPCGNGSIGALVHGNIRNECITLNHEKLFLPKPRPVVHDSSRHLARYRDMLSKGKYIEALDFFSKRLAEGLEGDSRPAPYQPLMDIKIDNWTAGAFKSYRRTLDFETGESCVSWKDDGKDFKRRLFVSRECDTVVLEMTASRKGSLNCDIWFSAHAVEKVSSMAGTKTAGLVIPFKCKSSAGNKTLAFIAEYENRASFGAVGNIRATGGQISYADGKAKVKNADKLMLTVKVFVFETASSALRRLRKELKHESRDYKKLLSAHTAIHGKIFNSMTLELGDTGAEMLSNEQLLLDSYDGEVPTELILKLFNYGRYLLISSSRPGGLPANLQGVWNGDYNPAWASDYHNDINIQMNYWQALPGNMPELAIPYFDYYQSMLEDYRANARLTYGCRGAMVPIAQTTHGLIYAPNIWTAWTAGAAWLAQLFYDFYLYTGDVEFLKERAVPFMKEAAIFYEDFVTEDKNGKLMFSPSLSPENCPTGNKECLLSINATMDIAVAKELLTNLCAACRLLDIENEGVCRWESMLAKLPEYEINDDGAVREWLYPGLKDNYHHRHMSHIYPLFPGIEIYEEKNKELFKAFEVAIEKRLVVGLTSQTGWSFAKMANVFSRLCRGDRALECIELICRSSLGQNLFTYHNDWRSQGLSLYWDMQPPFQIDANLGVAAAVLEMLVFSVPGLIKLLPALPAKWSEGKAENIQCRGGISLCIEWSGSKCFKARLRSRTKQAVEVKLPFHARDIKHANCACKKSRLGKAYVELTLEPGEEATLWIYP
ncbi:MAG: glycoside hydrolase N-terminal domain-containing protein [Victivallales bacterium]|nr:glycoside hydrolase N-terminal domain-containing protein [Victivallales bacterium]